MIGYHGTSADNLESILKNGIVCCPDKRNWVCSENAVYFWGDNFRKHECFEMDEEQSDYLIRDQAVYSAFPSLARAKDCRICLIKIEVPDHEVETDYSCENMDHANCIYRDIKPEEIREISISNDLSLLRGYFIASLMRMDLCGVDFTYLETMIAESMSDLCIDIQDILEWEEYDYAQNIRTSERIGVREIQRV